jgi:hypothetical protein
MANDFEPVEMARNEKRNTIMIDAETGQTGMACVMNVLAANRFYSGLFVI